MAVDRKQFWKSIKIWMKNSHVVNRRLGGVLQLFVFKLSTLNNTLDSVVKSYQELDFHTIASGNVEDKFKTINNGLENAHEFDENFCEIVDNVCQPSSLHIVVQKLLPRNPQFRDTFRLIFLDVNATTATFVSISENNEKHMLSPNIPYSFRLISDEIKLKIAEEHHKDPSAVWLTEKLLPRMLKWATSDIVNKNGISEGSINLISLIEYNELYQKLKCKYGTHIVEIWPEATDPSKFVYEDVAIASYLLLLWKMERQKSGNQNMQSFIDLGCGNGLLVYILSSEGHPGKGVDVRKRGIWDMFPDFVKLEVDAITPSKTSMYKDIDWIIGNHSDELTPWIPVIAANSSYECKFFLLPCCAYEFDGQKYQRYDSSKSQYNEYLEYVKSICRECGINTEIDRLKIPSTKRICLVGTSRSYQKENFENQLNSLHKFIEDRCKVEFNSQSKVNNPNGTEQWISNFKPRDPIEKVRNCTKIDRTIVKDIVETIVSSLLTTKNIINNWNAGGRLTLNEIVKLISTYQLKSLKSECGGLQTLLRNHHNIFEVISGDVKLRYPRTKSEVLEKFANSKNGKPKNVAVLTKKPCWFYENHPDRCPLIAEECSFLHI